MNDHTGSLRIRPVVDVRNVSMAYKIYNKPIDMLKEAVFGGVRHDTFWAVRDISLTLYEGDRLGIVGHNGAGKSTLLQVIAGNLLPTTGSVTVNGRISSLLSLVPAWNAEENGIQNIRFNLLMQGISEKSVAHLIEDIVDFTELGPFIYHPVKTYSTGMSARLAFAIATAIEPEVLIIDEVLGAGDGYFAGKAHRRMQEFCARGKALLFVSHATSAVQQLCDKVMWIHNGTVRLQGDAEYVLTQYETDFRNAEDEAVRTKHMAASAQRAKMIMPGEVPDESYLRFRIVADKATFLSGTHYVRTVRIEGVSEQRIDVPMELTDIAAHEHDAALDVLGSEWGRIHDHAGASSRILARATGRGLGGQFVIKLSPGTKPSFDILAEIESSSVETSEELSLEILDMVEGNWRPMACLGRQSSGGPWRRSKFVGTITVPHDRMAEVIDTIAQKALPAVEILKVYVSANGERTALLKELEPFEICVEVLFRKPPELADVLIKLNRSDGFHVFWQSSGLTGFNLVSPSGRKLVKFVFDPNDLAAGEYYVTSHVANGWKYPENFPYSQILARAINATTFKIIRQYAEVDFGALNKRMTVEVVSLDDPDQEEMRDAQYAGRA